MARIIYGVSGEGSGHSSRARVVADHLLKQGHELTIVSYDRGYRNLCGDFTCVETEGLHISSVDNKVSIMATLADNLSRVPSGKHRLDELRLLFKKQEPHCVISDFEPMTAYLGHHYKIPVLSLDNQHRMRYMVYPHPPGLTSERLLTESVIRAMVPKPDACIVTTFYFGETTNERTFLCPPILRDQVLALEPARGEHLLVYLTSGYDSLVARLGQFPRERFRVYGYDEDREQGNLHYRPFSNEGFLDDLATARGVIATAGFTLMTEAMYLGKPYLALPMQGQFEQELNAYLLARMEMGKCCREVSDDALASFLYHLPDYAAKLEKAEPWDQSILFGHLDRLLADDASQMKEYRRQRKADQ